MDNLPTREELWTLYNTAFAERRVLAARAETRTGADRMALQREAGHVEGWARRAFTAIERKQYRA